MLIFGTMAALPQFFLVVIESHGLFFQMPLFSGVFLQKTLIGINLLFLKGANTITRSLLIPLMGSSLSLRSSLSWATVFLLNSFSSKPDSVSSMGPFDWKQKFKNQHEKAQGDKADEKAREKSEEREQSNER